ncbi:MAG TPA: hypothetical protein VGH89_13065 [Pseudonocardia sp.]|jgi:hypothetical protein
MTINDADEPYAFDFQAAAEIIAGWPDVHAGLLARHVAGPDGRCRGCASSVRLAPHAPCSLRRLAELASTVRASGAVRRTAPKVTGRAEKLGPAVT